MAQPEVRALFERGLLACVIYVVCALMRLCHCICSAVLRGAAFQFAADNSPLLPTHRAHAAELMCFLRDAVDTRKPPLMEVALDAIQKLISFKLLQGPVHHINHRWGWCRRQHALHAARQQMLGQRWMHASRGFTIAGSLLEHHHAA